MQGFDLSTKLLLSVMHYPSHRLSAAVLTGPIQVIMFLFFQVVVYYYF